MINFKVYALVLVAIRTCFSTEDGLFFRTTDTKVSLGAVVANIFPLESITSCLIACSTHDCCHFAGVNGTTCVHFTKTTTTIDLIEVTQLYENVAEDKKCPRYFKGCDCKTLKGIEESLDEECTSMVPSVVTYARYDYKTHASINWRCYKAAALTEDTYFWNQGPGYYTFPIELEAVLNNHPLIAKYRYALSETSNSCIEKCRSISMNCSPDLYTVNSVYFFNLLLASPCMFSTTPQTSAGNSFWSLNKQHPYYDPRDNTCHAFINSKTVYCETIIPNVQLLCQCYPYDYS